MPRIRFIYRTFLKSIGGPSAPSSSIIVASRSSPRSIVPHYNANYYHSTPQEVTLSKAENRISKPNPVCPFLRAMPLSASPSQSRDMSSTVQTPALPGAIVPCSANKEFILTLSCADRVGIVYKITSLLANEGYNILDSQQFGDSSTSRFFMRVHFAPHVEPEGQTVRTESVSDMKEKFEQVRKEYEMQLEVFDAGVKPRVMVMVSKIGHTLNDLLFRAASGAIPIDIPLIVSNHPDFEPMATSYNIPFKHLPFNGKDPVAKKTQEAEVLELFAAYECEHIVLARYMQIISPDMCAALPGKILNIHHSALPSFLGANPYRQAYNRGVKLIGATSHFVTADLDEGPIIAQEVVPVDHTLSPKALTQLGSTVENVVLGRAVKAVAERRVLLNGYKTVVFS